MGQITAASLNKRLKEPGPHIDGDGLILLVKGSGSASWILRKQKDGRRVDYGIGGLGDLPIAAAREKAAKYREMIAAGIDPRQVKAKERTPRRLSRRLKRSSTPANVPGRMASISSSGSTR